MKAELKYAFMVVQKCLKSMYNFSAYILSMIFLKRLLCMHKFQKCLHPDSRIIFPVRKGGEIPGNAGAIALAQDGLKGQGN